MAEASALDFVNVVDVEGREDRVYLFADRGDADRFASVINDAAGGDEYNPAFLSETPINFGDAAERLIAAERGDVLEGMGLPAAAEDLRSGVVPAVIAGRIEGLGDLLPAAQRDRCISLLQRWAEEDAKGGQS